MSNPFICDLPLAEQIKNVVSAMQAAETSLMLDYGKTTAQAEELVNATTSRSWKLAKPWCGVAYEYVSARAQWRDLLERGAANAIVEAQ